MSYSYTNLVVKIPHRSCVAMSVDNIRKCSCSWNSL